MTTEDRFDTLQRLTTLGAALGSLSMAVQYTLSESGIDGIPVLVAALSSLVGWALFGVMIMKTRRLGTSPEGKTFLSQAVNDERLNAIRNRAFSTGFVAVITLQALFLLLDVLLVNTAITAPITAPLTIGIGVTVSLIAYHRIQDNDR